MIPFFEMREIVLGPLVLQVWGIMVSTGFVVSLLTARYLARVFGISYDAVLQGYVWTAVGGFIGARIVHCVFYNPVYYAAHPLEVFMLWIGGFSSLGGIVGGACALALIMRSQPQKSAIAHVLAIAWVPGWIVGRVGCFMIHDHPGTPSTGIFAVAFPAGARYDMAFLEILALMPLMAVLCALLFQGARGAYAYGIVLYYAVLRLYLDAFRAWDIPAADARIAGFTPMQWISMIFISASITIFYVTYHPHRRHARPRVLAP